MAYQHGVRVQEQATSIVAPILGTAGLQVVFGTAPVNLAEKPYAVTNKPIIAYNWAEAVKQLGYSAEKDSKQHFRYTLCASMFANFKLFGVAPVIFVNVLDPKKHKKKNSSATLAVEDMVATLALTGVLADTVKVTAEVEATKYNPVTPVYGDNPAAEGWYVLVDGEYTAATDTYAVNGTDYYAETTETETVTLTLGTDYVLSFDDSGYLVVTLLDGGAAAKATKITVAESTSIDPDAVTKDNIIGASSGADEKGMEVLRQVYPKFGMTPGLLLAPGWSHIPDVGIVLAAKCEEINGYFTCEAFVDIDSTDTGCTVYSDVKQQKEKAGCTSKHVEALWPCIAVGTTKFWYSAIQAAATSYLDATNDDVPNLSPSNKLLGVTGTVLADALYTETADENGNTVGAWDKEVLLDQLQANAVNGFGVTTALNTNGWRNWGNNTAAYPATTDPKDRWFCCRRFFSWWGNSFILTYAQKVDDPSNRRLIESIVDSENIRGNAYVSQGKCAAAYIEFNADENAVTDLLNGKLTFHQHLAPYVPAEDIVNTLEFDPDALASALTA